MKYVFLLLLCFPLYLSAQIIDDFSDGDFSANPTWQGDTDKFIVNADLQLQLQDPVPTDTALLLLPSTEVDDVEWSFYMKLDFNPSTNNLLRVYLMTDSEILTEPLNGYFLEVGEGGSLDALSLYKQTGTEEEVLITGLPNAGETPEFNVKVLRSATGEWTYLLDLEVDGSFTEVGTAVDNSHESSNFLGLLCKHTSNNDAAFFFDDFYIGPEIVDTEGPEVLSIEVLGSTSVLISFNEAVAAGPATDITNYSVDGVNPVSAELTSSTSVTLTFADEFVEESELIVEITDMADSVGNLTASQSISFSYNIISPGEIVITELFFKINSDFGFTAEYVELYNTSPVDIDLTGFEFKDAGASTTQITSGIIPANGYAILCKESDAEEFESLGNLAIVGNLPTLNDTGDDAILLLEGLQIDQVSYLDDWLDDAVKISEGGWALERIDINVPCNGESNWSASLDPSGGTPGRENSIAGTLEDSQAPILLGLTILPPNGLELEFDEDIVAQTAENLSNYQVDQGVGNPSSISAGGTTVILGFDQDWQGATSYTLNISDLQDCLGNAFLGEEAFGLPEAPSEFEVVISEIMFDETPGVALPEAEYIELHNSSDKFFDLRDWSIVTNDGTPKLFESYLLKPQEYVIVCKEEAAVEFSSYGSVTSTSSNVSLPNTGTNVLLLRDVNGNPLHRVTYSVATHTNPAKEDGGWSLELKDIAKACVQKGNWCSSDSPTGGTPGQPNSVAGEITDEEAPKLINLEVLEPNGLRLVFDEALSGDAENPANYAVNQSIGEPVSVIVDYNVVQLSYASDWELNTIYNIELLNLRDCLDNTHNLSGEFARPETAAALDVVITEVMYDDNPVVLLPELEYLEIYNRSEKFFNLRDWSIKSDDDDNPDNDQYFNAYLLKPGEYATVVKEANQDSFTVYGSVATTRSQPDLTNVSETLILSDNTGNWVFQVTYESSMHSDAVKREGGWSLEMIDTNNPCQAVGNWTSCTNMVGGTPGAANSVAAALPDETFPDLLRANYSNQSIILSFTEVLSPTMQLEPTMFSVDNGIEIVEVNFEQGDRTKMVLSIDQALQENTIYTVTVEQVQDCAGNPVGILNTARVGIPGTIDDGDLIINEILHNAKDGEKDYLEIYNASNEVLDLQNVLIGKGDIEQEDFPATSVVNVSPDQQLLMFPGDFFVFTVSTESVLNNYTVQTPAHLFRLTDLPAIEDDEGVIQILAPPFGFKIDEVHFFDDWHSGLISNDNGVALERTSYTGESSDANNWQSAASTIGFGTPTAQNSQYVTTGSALQESFVIEPRNFSPDEDGNADFTRLRYQVEEPGSAMSITIFDDRGREVRRLVQNQLLTTEGFVQWDGTDEDGQKVGIGIYILLVEIFDLEGNLEQFKRTCVVTGRI